MNQSEKPMDSSFVILGEVGPEIEVKDSKANGNSASTAQSGNQTNVKVAPSTEKPASTQATAPETRSASIQSEPPTRDRSGALNKDTSLPRNTSQLYGVGAVLVKSDPKTTSSLKEPRSVSQRTRPFQKFGPSSSTYTPRCPTYEPSAFLPKESLGHLASVPIETSWVRPAEIIGIEEKSAFMDSYQQYKIRFTEGKDAPREVGRRFAQFKHLHDQLLELAPELLWPALPSTKDSQERKIQLESYLNKLLSHEMVKKAWASQVQEAVKPTAQNAADQIRAFLVNTEFNQTKGIWNQGSKVFKMSKDIYNGGVSLLNKAKTTIMKSSEVSIAACISEIETLVVGTRLETHEINQLIKKTSEWYAGLEVHEKLNADVHKISQEKFGKAFGSVSDDQMMSGDAEAPASKTGPPAANPPGPESKETPLSKVQQAIKLIQSMGVLEPPQADNSAQTTFQDYMNRYTDQVITPLRELKEDTEAAVFQAEKLLTAYKQRRNALMARDENEDDELKVQVARIENLRGELKELKPQVTVVRENLRANYLWFLDEFLLLVIDD